MLARSSSTLLSSPSSKVGDRRSKNDATENKDWLKMDIILYKYFFYSYYYFV